MSLPHHFIEFCANFLSQFKSAKGGRVDHLELGKRISKAADGEDGTGKAHCRQKWKCKSQAGTVQERGKEELMVLVDCGPLFISHAIGYSISAEADRQATSQ